MTADGTTIVLGWDALDSELVSDFALEEEFGPYNKSIETFDNPDLGEPHTWELWPTLITGLDPDEHGIIHSSKDQGMKWENPIVQLSSTVSAKIIPKSTRAMVGRWLRNKGAAVEQYGPEYYLERDIKTVFDDRSSRPISIPNYHTEEDRDLGLSFDRGPIFEQYVTKRESGNGEHWEPTVSQANLEERLTSELLSRVGVIRSALQRDYDIIWIWFGFLDTVGHLEPSLEDSFQHRAYQLAADVTQDIRNEASKKDTVVCVSDHGLQDGSHTHDAIFASEDADLVDEVDSVFDVAPALNTHTKRTNSSPTLRDQWKSGPPSDQMTTEKVKNSLESLGYI